MVIHSPRVSDSRLRYASVKNLRHVSVLCDELRNEPMMSVATSSGSDGCVVWRRHCTSNFPCMAKQLLAKVPKWANVARK